MILADTGVILLSDRGMIGGSLAPAYTAPDWLMAVEMFWFAEDGQGLRLLRGFEQWAADGGASEVRMTTLAGLSQADAILTRRGYAALETSYTKVI